LLPFFFFLNVGVIVGCHRTAASVLLWPALLRSRVLLPGRHHRASDPVDIA
jgi:hypothetical protein